MPRSPAAQIHNANVYVNGDSYVGRVETARLPVIKRLMAEHKPLGLVAKTELPLGLDTMDMELTWSAPTADAYRATMGRDRVNLQLRAVLEEIGAGGATEEQQVLVAVTGVCKESELGEFQQNSKVMPKQVYTVYYCRLEIAGQLVFEIDVFANRWQVGAIDMLARTRRLLGV